MRTSLACLLLAKFNELKSEKTDGRATLDLPSMKGK
jgi:hypothetical protein